MKTRRMVLGFTLIELLVVIAIIAILAGILFPVFAQARQRALETRCLSHGKEIGIAVRMYVDDNESKWPPLVGFNTNPPPGSPGHIGPEELLESYTKEKELFRCSSDTGGAFTGGKTYYETYGQSFQMCGAVFSKIPGASIVNDSDVTMNKAWFPDPYFAAHVVTDSEFDNPSKTKMVRECVMPWFITDAAKYGMSGWYNSRWHSRGGTIVFVDGHASFITSQAEFDELACTPQGDLVKNACPTGPNPRPDWW